MAEEDVLKAIEFVVRRLSRRFAFGYYDADDIGQLIRLHSVELLREGKYDCSRPLAGYLLSHCRNRLINLRRDKLHRQDAPCQLCRQADQQSQPEIACQEGFCPRYKAWRERNRTKFNLMVTTSVDTVREDEPQLISDPADNLEITEILTMIDEKISLENRANWLRLRAGVSVPTVAKQRVITELVDILDGLGVELPEGLEL